MKQFLKYINQEKIIHRGRTFLLIGLFAVCIDYLFYSSFVRFGFNVSVSKAIGFIFGTSFSFLGNRKITFNSSFTKVKFLKYFILYVITLNLNVFFNNAIINLFSSINFSTQIAFLLTTCTCAVINFVGLNNFVFKN